MFQTPEISVQIDQSELHDYRRVCPKEFLAQIPSPDIMIMSPIFVSLKKLTEFSSVKTVISHTHEAETDIFETRFVKELKGFVTLWRPDVAYDTLELSTPGPRQRLNCYSGGWEYQRS